MGQDQILLRAHPKLSEAVAIHQVGEARHLRRGGIAGGAADGLQGHHHACEAGALMSPAIHLKPLHKGRRAEVGDGGVLRRGGRWEETFHPIPLSFGKVEGVPRQARPAGLHLLSKGLKAQAIDENLDSRLIEIVPAAMGVVDPKHGGQVAEQILGCQKCAKPSPNPRRAPLAAADPHLEAAGALRAPHPLQANIVKAQRRSIFPSAVDGDLEFPR